jgi:tetratricopeptide (TPR) repeat protein
MQLGGLIGHLCLRMPRSKNPKQAAPLGFQPSCGWILCMRHRRIISLALASCIGMGMPAAADQHDPSLEPLMTELKTASTVGAARLIEQQIWVIWGKSGDKAVDTLMEQGVARLNQGDDDAALALFDRIVGLAPGFAEGWNKRATTLYSMGLFERSIADIDKVLALEPRHFGALSGLGLCNIRLGNDKAALVAFQRAAALDPNLPGVQANIEALKKRLIRNSI